MFKTLTSWVIVILALFAVLFDPTELALGAQFIELPEFLLSIAVILGNVLWLLGVLYVIITLSLLYVIFDDGATKEALNKAVNKAVAADTSKAFKARWYEVPRLILHIAVAMLFIGSGFWFTGITMLVAQLATRAYIHTIRELSGKEHV